MACKSIRKEDLNIYFVFLLPIVLLVYILFFWKWQKHTQSFYPKDRPLLFGHRGSPTKRTENTIPSFEKAIEQGVDGLEFDIRLTKDKKIIIFHDKDLKRLAGEDKKIQHLTGKQLQEINLEQNEKIPLLNEIVPLIEKVNVVNIEIKSDGLFQGHSIVTPLIQFLDKQQIDNKCIISSFNPLIILQLKLRRKKTIIGYLYNRNQTLHQWNNLVWMIRIRPDNLHIHYSLLDLWIVSWARGKGMKINSYTINERKVYENAKIDGVFTDNIEYLK